jgi:8-oxo-dGTP pyrophosphatase MutT (NUDIX family)
MIVSALEHTVLRSEDRYRGRSMAFRGEWYRLPDGREAGPYGILDYPDWVNALALTKDGRVVLVRQFRPGPRKVTLELPGGAVEPDEESLEAAMRRELEEETGYGGGAITYLTGLSPNSASHTNRVHSFLAVGVEPVGKTHPDDNEFIEVALLPLPEVVALARAGGIDQSMHVATLFLALAELHLTGLEDLSGLLRAKSG